ncbi:MAG: YicC family protein [Verrucomicrobiales bacterium]|nr:YicC family protein [Verrucomicrobiales bacterium]
MTGFGAGEAENPQWRATAELSGVNRKQLDISIGLPQSVSSLEPAVRSIISDGISRGRINARINLTNQAEQSTVLVVDQDLAAQYVAAAKTLAETTGIDGAVSAADLLRNPGICKIEETGVAPEDVEDLIKIAVSVALEKLNGMQTEEGTHLRDDLEDRIKVIESEIASVSSYAREVVDKYRESLQSRLAECGLDLDLNDERVLREIALYAEKSDITEEITRIGSHIAQFRKYFASDEPVGRPLDFLCQELNRELNTIGSKSNHAQIAQAIVNSKTELEKIREQVQNIQ